jgi:hypothetical protein
MASIIQLIETELPVVEVFLPIIESGLASVVASLPSVYNTPPVSVRIGGHVYSASLVLNKVS